MRKITSGLAVAGIAFGACTGAWAADVIKIGFIPYTWAAAPVPVPKNYETFDMIRERVNGSGGLKVGDKSYKLEFVSRGFEYKQADLEWNTRNAVAVTTKLILEDKVFAIVGPEAQIGAACGAQIADICNTYEVLEIAYQTSDDEATRNRQWVFQIGPGLEEVADAMARFAKEELKARTAALVYKIDAKASRSVSELFKEAFERLNGKGSVVAFEAATNKDVLDLNIGAQIKKIAASRADVFVIATLPPEACGIIRQVRELGYKGHLLSGYSWNHPDAINVCPELLAGVFTRIQFVPSLATGPAKDFVDAYWAKYGHAPESSHGAAWDALNLLLQAIQNTNGLTGDMRRDQKAVRDQLFKIRAFPGVTGNLWYDGMTGEPRRCINFVRITGQVTETGGFELVRTVCP